MTAVPPPTTRARAGQSERAGNRITRHGPGQHRYEHRHRRQRPDDERGDGSDRRWSGHCPTAGGDNRPGRRRLDRVRPDDDRQPGIRRPLRHRGRAAHRATGYGDGIPGDGSRRSGRRDTSCHGHADGPDRRNDPGVPHWCTCRSWPAGGERPQQLDADHERYPDHGHPARRHHRHATDPRPGTPVGPTVNPTAANTAARSPSRPQRARPRRTPHSPPHPLNRSGQPNSRVRRPNRPPRLNRHSRDRMRRHPSRPTGSARRCRHRRRASSRRRRPWTRLRPPTRKRTRTPSPPIRPSSAPTGRS